ncbi:MAG: 23S rRNA (guanosine(2251)-2'-O)-methyltransferase RlmB [Rhizomicrobium sp.]|nr:23S rRNA (guanosine(2251)-2'-O)-methyltransferase RlmB [Rhizomicrobium sp.]
MSKTPPPPKNAPRRSFASKGSPASSKDAGKAPSKRPGKDFGKAPGKSFAKAPGKSFGKGAGKSFGKEGGKSFAKDSGKSFSRDTGKSFAKESGKGFSKDRPYFESRPKPESRPQADSRPAVESRPRTDSRPSEKRPYTEKRAFFENRVRREKPVNDGLWLYGIHAVRAALANPQRRVKRLLVTNRAAEEIGEKLMGRVRHEVTDGDSVARMLPAGAVHQGVALQCDPLHGHTLAEVLQPSERRRIVLVLDQISDPHNAGAILRTAAAFGVSVVIVQDRNSPPETGALAKSASGALDLIPVVSVVNISRTLDDLGKLGFWRVALAGDGESPLKDAGIEGDVALVLGSEGSGIRRLVREHCDAAAYVPMDSAMESLNVSNAAAIALYELRR